MNKKLTAVITTGALAAGIVVGASANGIIQKVQSELRGDFVVQTNGQVQTLKNANGEVVYPMLYEGTTYLPVRAIAELNNKEVVWYEDTKTIDIVDKKTSTVTDADKIVNGNQGTQTPAPTQPSQPAQPAQPAQTPQPAQNNQQNTNISLEQAKELALQKAGLSASQVQFKKAKLDFDDGRWEYEIEFINNFVEYEAEIDAQTGAFYKWEVDRD